LREVFRRMIPNQRILPLNFSDIVGNFYRHLFRVLPRREFGFLHDAFEEFGIEDWKGFIRGQDRYFSAAVRRNSRWVTAHFGSLWPARNFTRSKEQLERSGVSNRAPVRPDFGQLLFGAKIRSLTVSAR
jgi:hypothetical protein